MGATFWGQQPGGWDWKAANRGGLAAVTVAGTMVASAALPGLVPAWPGALPGLMMAGGQFTSTALGTGAYSWMTTGTFKPNWTMAALCAIPGLIQAGVGGIRAFRQGRSFWGFDVIKEYLSVMRTPFSTVDGTSLNPSNETLDDFSKTFFKDFKYRDNAKLIYEKGFVESSNKPKSWALFSTKANDGVHNIHFAKSAFDTKWTLYLAMGHEYVHVANFVNGFTNLAYSEYAAYIWNYRVSQNTFFLDQANAEFSSIRFYKSIADKYMQYGTWDLWTTIPRGIY
jgi:hypothetical protein